MRQPGVMLVDDELLVRLGIRSLIDWEKHGFEFMGDAADGEEALALMAQGAPDILLTDIVMPRMDGLALIEHVKRAYPKTLIIVLSSHNEYDYVRRAMKMGIEDYLLKTSLKPAELLALLSEAAEKIARERERESMQAVQAAQAVRAAETVRKDEAAGRRERLSKLLLSALAAEPDDKAFRALAEAEEPRPNYSLLVLGMLRMREGVQEQSASGLLAHLVRSELAGRLASDPAACGGREVAALLHPPADRCDADRLVAELAAASRQLLGISLAGGVQGPFDDWRQLPELYGRIRHRLSVAEAQDTPRSDIKRLLDYMSANYADTLSLKAAAAMVNMSESYLSTVFKRETGKGFTDWINMLRIERAAAELAETDLPGYLIAERVGYENVNYFGRLFKKIKGVSPQQFRAQRQKDGK
ncbi:response regulator [Cohnella sp. GCM10020058]|uniref:response regulator transcription factor n=1 Tax=Cohnella sp. GCM10020058 TaxID=3317330 RepID=UPI00363410A9